MRNGAQLLYLSAIHGFDNDFFPLSTPVHNIQLASRPLVRASPAGHAPAVRRIITSSSSSSPGIPIVKKVKLPVPAVKKVVLPSPAKTSQQQQQPIRVIKSPGGVITVLGGAASPKKEAVIKFAVPATQTTHAQKDALAEAVQVSRIGGGTVP